MQTSANLMEQIEKITKVVQPDFKIFVGDSLAGNDTVNQAREFHNHVTLNGSILTKSDADARGGAALSIVKVTSTPVIYVGTGQEYDDIISFNKNTFLENVFEENENELELDSTISLSEPTPEPEPTPAPDESDPFDGIDTDDINEYADLFDVPPPENDKQANELAKKIKKWISDGRPNP